MITQPHRSEEVVTIDRRTEQTMRAWMDDITDEVNSFISGYGLSGSYTYKTAAYSATYDDFTINCNGTFEVSLPTAAGYRRQDVQYKKQWGWCDYCKPERDRNDRRRLNCCAFYCIRKHHDPKHWNKLDYYMTYQPRFNNLISTANSSSTPLNAGIAFSGRFSGIEFRDVDS